METGTRKLLPVHFEQLTTIQSELWIIYIQYFQTPQMFHSNFCCHLVIDDIPSKFRGFQKQQKLLFQWLISLQIKKLVVLIHQLQRLQGQVQHLLHLPLEYLILLPLICFLRSSSWFCVFFLSPLKCLLLFFEPQCLQETLSGAAAGGLGSLEFLRNNHQVWVWLHYYYFFDRQSLVTFLYDIQSLK